MLRGGYERLTDGQTDRRTDRQGESNIPPYFVAGGIMTAVHCCPDYQWNPSMTRVLPSPKANNVICISMSWRHHGHMVCELKIQRVTQMETGSKYLGTERAARHILNQRWYLLKTHTCITKPMDNHIENTNLQIIFFKLKQIIAYNNEIPETNNVMCCILH